MKIELVLAVTQSLEELNALKRQAPDEFFILEKPGQTNVLLLNPEKFQGQFKEPIVYELGKAGKQLAGKHIYQVDFGYQDDVESSLIDLANDHGVLAFDPRGKAQGMYWTFWESQAELDHFLTSDNYQAMKQLMKDPFATVYTNN
ncbi:hypothetical protein [Eupransor demetentiae]|uniref:Uncharacterized protein n=1 Tax=Eupransor demetentiae TaxID=3109584 RepID=A0ABP0EP96_9LACO|nr:hypothetical protein R54876_GBNLAHCA_00075 [Lactobacillaceae bacterium LMG 33000]